MLITATNISTSQSKKLKKLLSQSEKHKHLNMPIAKKTNISISQLQKHKYLNVPITDTNIAMSPSQNLKHLNEPIAKTQTFKYGKHTNISMRKSQQQKKEKKKLKRLVKSDPNPKSQNIPQRFQLPMITLQRMFSLECFSLPSLLLE